MVSIIASIHNKHIENIISGKKTIELRKNMPTNQHWNKTGENLYG